MNTLKGPITSQKAGGLETGNQIKSGKKHRPVRVWLEFHIKALGRKRGPCDGTRRRIDGLGGRLPQSERVPSKKRGTIPTEVVGTRQLLGKKEEIAARMPKGKNNGGWGGPQGATQGAGRPPTASDSQSTRLFRLGFKTKPSTGPGNEN